MASRGTRLNATPRTTAGSRAMRRLRRAGRVPGVLYGGAGDAVAFDVDARELRHALHAAGAVLEVTLDGETTPAVLKDTQRHPVRGETLHLHGTDRDDEWLLTLDPDGLRVERRHAKADLALRGAVSDLELLLYQRPTLGEVERLGDERVLDAWQRVFTFG